MLTFAALRHTPQGAVPARIYTFQQETGQMVPASQVFDRALAQARAIDADARRRLGIPVPLPNQAATTAATDPHMKLAIQIEGQNYANERIFVTFDSAEPTTTTAKGTLVGAIADAFRTAAKDDRTMNFERVVPSIYEAVKRLRLRNVQALGVGTVRHGDLGALALIRLGATPYETAVKVYEKPGSMSLAYREPMFHDTLAQILNPLKHEESLAGMAEPIVKALGFRAHQHALNAVRKDAVAGRAPAYLADVDDAALVPATEVVAAAQRRAADPTHSLHQRVRETTQTYVQ